jgi:hypothetical protein
MTTIVGDTILNPGCRLEGPCRPTLPATLSPSRTRSSAADGSVQVAAAAAGPLRRTSAFPETDPAVRLEGGHRAHRAAVDEEGAVPLDSLLDLGAGGVHHLAPVLDDRLGEGGSLTQLALQRRSPARLLFTGPSPPVGGERRMAPRPGLEPGTWSLTVTLRTPVIRSRRGGMAFSGRGWPYTVPIESPRLMLGPRSDRGRRLVEAAKQLAIASPPSLPSEGRAWPTPGVSDGLCVYLFVYEGHTSHCR